MCIDMCLDMCIDMRVDMRGGAAFSFFGAPFIWGVLHNFGGNVGLWGRQTISLPITAPTTFTYHNLSIKNRFCGKGCCKLTVPTHMLARTHACTHARLYTLQCVVAELWAIRGVQECHIGGWSRDLSRGHRPGTFFLLFPMATF